MGAFMDLSGQRFGRLIVIEQTAPRLEGGRKRTSWLCQCDCGNTCVTTGKMLRRGDAQSCGCLGKERRRASTTKHGASHDRLYRIWVGMKQRCLNTSNCAYPYYGGRGIGIHADWLSFEAFRDWSMANGYSDALTIDRVNPDGDYAPNNCRWATMAEQGSNKRNSKRVEFRGELRTVPEWAKITGVPQSVIYSRLKYPDRWPVEKALTTPVGGGSL